MRDGAVLCPQTTTVDSAVAKMTKVFWRRRTRMRTNGMKVITEFDTKRWTIATI